MAVNSVLTPYPWFPDNTGAALENGFVYIGQPGFEARSTPKASFFDVAQTIPTGTASGAAIRTMAGFPVRNGSPAMLYVDGDFSISVTDKNGVLLYSALNTTLALNVGGTTGPILAPDGNLSATGFGFISEPNSGLVRSAAGTVQDVVTGVVVSQRTATGTVFQQPVSGAGFVAGVAASLDADLTALAALSGTGLAVRTGTNTWANRQATSADGSITITNPGGVAGNIDFSAAGYGVSQTRSDVIGSRAFGTSYQNTTGKPIGVNPRVTTNGASTVTAETSPDNSVWTIIARCQHNVGSTWSDSSILGEFIVPNNLYYRVRNIAGTNTLTAWLELR